jgi:hypothetical protein
MVAATMSVGVSAQSLTRQPHGEVPEGGIKVNGHWTIDVHDTDGMLASHTEFENALTLTGGAALGKLLAGNTAVLNLMVVLDGSTPQAPPCLPTPCVLVPNTQLGQALGNVYVGNSSTSPAVFTTLSTLTQSTGPGLVLSGLATTKSGKIGKVRTVVVLQCPLAPAVCDPTIQTALAALPHNPTGAITVLAPTLTEFSLPASGIDVAEGQVVTVSVTLTFSS